MMAYSRKKPNFIRYHKNIEFPDNIGFMILDFFQQFDEVNVTYHSANQLIDDKRGVIPLPDKRTLLAQTNILVEVYEIVDDFDQPTGVIQKALIRVKHLSEEFDYCYVVAREGFIVSAWANDKDDEHRILNRDAYYSSNFNRTMEMPECLREASNG